MRGERKVYTLAQVSEHNTSKDCGLIIDGKVYDVTKFLDDHPGGDDVLLSSTGRDATDDFEDVGHSKSARAMLDDLYVGDIDPTTIPARVKQTLPKQPQTNQDKVFIIIRLHHQNAPVSSSSDYRRCCGQFSLLQHQINIVTETA